MGSTRVTSSSRLTESRFFRGLASKLFVGPLKPVEPGVEYNIDTVGAWKLFYDGGCNLCHVSQLRVEKWARHANQPLNVDVLASDEAIAKGYGDAMVLEADGEVFFADQAWFKLASIGPWYVRWTGFFNRSRPTQALARWAYNLVAKYRYRVFGTRECVIPASNKL